MVFPVKADIIRFVEGIVFSLSPFAQAHKINLECLVPTKNVRVVYQPDIIAQALTQLLTRIIVFTPTQFSVKVFVEPQSNPECLEVLIENTGINLSRTSEIWTGIKCQTKVSGRRQGTSFRLIIPVQGTEKPCTGAQFFNSRHLIKPWYAEIRKRLTHHFSVPSNIEQAVQQRNEEEGVFIGKVHAAIYNHLGDERFNASMLAKTMAMSRSQLFRKVKQITDMAPGQYIRLVKMQKAKELLETTDLNINEIAFRIGFNSSSHFSRVFHQEFGINPSKLKSHNPLQSTSHFRKIQPVAS